MMKINELIQVGTREEEYIETIPATYDEEGNELTAEYTEVRTRTVPVMASVTRDATAEEEATMAAAEPLPEAEDELTALRRQLSELQAVVDTMLGGDGA